MGIPISSPGEPDGSREPIRREIGYSQILLHFEIIIFLLSLACGVCIRMDFSHPLLVHGMMHSYFRM